MVIWIALHNCKACCKGLGSEVLGTMAFISSISEVAVAQEVERAV